MFSILFCSVKKAPVPTNIKHSLGQQGSQERRFDKQFTHSVKWQIPSTCALSDTCDKQTFLVLLPIAQGRGGLWMVPSLNSLVSLLRDPFVPLSLFQVMICCWAAGSTVHPPSSTCSHGMVGKCSSSHWSSATVCWQEHPLPSLGNPGRLPPAWSTSMCGCNVDMRICRRCGTWRDYRQVCSGRNIL